MQSVKQNLLAAFRYLLKPMVRLAVKNAVSLNEFSDALRSAFVDVATRQLRATGRDVSDEGIALIAQMETRDVAAVRRAIEDVTFAVQAESVSPMPTILEKWHTDPDFTGPYGVVRDISFVPVPGIAGTSFTELAQKYCPGADAAALLNELVRTGCVQEVGNGFYRAIKRVYVPDPLSTESIMLFARVVHNICETLTGNLSKTAEEARLGGSGAFMQRVIYAVHGVSREDLRLFDRYVRDRGQKFADDIDNWLSDKDVEGLPGAIRTGVGIYQYVVNEEDEQALSKELKH